MDFLNQSIAQIGELFKGMTPGARITAGLLLAVVVTSLAFLFQFNPNSPNDALFGGREFSADELTAAQAAFAEAGLSNFQIERNRIHVPYGQKAAYLGAMASANALPKDWNSFLDDVMANSSPFQSHKDKDTYLKLTIENRAAQIISSFPKIRQATVRHHERRKPGLRSELDVSAVAAVEPKGNEKLTERDVESIRQFVAGFWANLQPEDVTVTDVSGLTYAAAGDSDAPGARNNQVLKIRQEYQDELRSKLYDLLGDIEGVKIVTNVTLDETLETRSTSTKYDPQVAPIRKESVRLVDKRGTGQPGGTPGTASNAVNNQGASVTTSQSQQSSKDQRTDFQESIPSAEQTTTVVAGLKLKQAKVTVRFPDSYYLKVWRSKKRSEGVTDPETPNANDLSLIKTEVEQNIKDQIEPLLPDQDAGESRYPNIVIKSYPAPVTQSLPDPGIVENASTWLGRNWATIGMMGLGLTSLVLLRNAVKGPPATRPPSPSGEDGGGLSVLGFDDDELENEEPNEMPSGPKRRFATGNSLRNELAEMVNDDPESAAAILRGWISDAG